MIDVYRYKDVLFDEITQDSWIDRAHVCYDHANYHRLDNQPDIHMQDIGYRETCGVVGCTERADVDIRFDDGALTWERITEEEYRRLVEQEPDEPDMDI